jgi:hypothetical protein
MKGRNASMVPVDYANFFAVMAGVGATLFGLIFLVISIRPEITSTENASIMRQVQIASSYTALLNPLVISLRALVPHATIGLVTLIMSAIGLVNTIVMGVSLLQDAMRWQKKLNSIFFILSSTVIFSFEIFYAIRLEVAPGDPAALDSLTTLLVLIYLYGIARAWDLVGARRFRLQELFAPLVPKRMQGIISDTLHAESTKDARKQGD